MGTVQKMAEVIRKTFTEALPNLSKPLLKKIPLSIAALIEVMTPNTSEIANVLPFDTQRASKEQWLRRLLHNTRCVSHEIMAPFARAILAWIMNKSGLIMLSMDQSDIGNRFAILTISIKFGNRALPLAWRVEEGAANIGFEGQKTLLERVRSWLPEGAAVMLSGDRFYPSIDLFKWLKEARWPYRLRLKGNVLIDVGQANIKTTGDLAKGGIQERYEPKALLFAERIETSVGVLHEPGHKEPWIIAMDCTPIRETVLEYHNRWSIEPMFSDFKTRGFDLEHTQLEAPDRVDRLILLMSLALYWFVKIGFEDATNHPTGLEAKVMGPEDMNPERWEVKKWYRSMVSWFTRGRRVLAALLQSALPLPSFFPSYPHLYSG